MALSIVSIGVVAIYNSQASMLFDLSTQTAFPFNHLSPPMNNIILFFMSE
jgi:hypothetical protein